MYLVFDIGATHTRLAFSKSGKNFGEIKKFKTPKRYFQGLNLIKEFAANQGKIFSAAGGIAGSIDKKKDAIYKSPNLPDWSGGKLSRDLEQILKTKVVIENDTALAGLGEAVYGAGKGISIVAYVTVSTGINGALVVDKKLVPTAQGFEVGHQIIQDGKTLEFFVGGASILKQYKKTPEEVLKSQQGKQIVEFLATGLHNTILHWSPEVLVLGGSQMQTIKLADINKYLTSKLNIFPRVPEMKKAALGDRSGLVGALELLKYK